MYLWIGSVVAIAFALGFIGAYAAINLCDQFRICKREVPKLLSPRAFMVFMAISVGMFINIFIYMHEYV
jgi:hypothetical protein